MTQSSQALSSATDHLSEAFSRLQQAVKDAASRSAASPDLAQMEEGFRQQIGALQAENVQLREENQTLYTQLQQLREAYDEMQERNDTIAYQIDRQIEQLELIA